jgi:uncharacterized protein
MAAELPADDSTLCEFRPSPIHGTGGFARRRIEPETRVLQYRGELVSKEESLRRCQKNNTFLFYFDEAHDLDGQAAWNPARFLNHSCSPNCEARKLGQEIWIVAIRAIEPGEEITFDYGYDLEDYQDYPCRCGSPACRGYMVDTTLARHITRRALDP